jgi:hypothetical protein
MDNRQVLLPVGVPSSVRRDTRYRDSTTALQQLQKATHILTDEIASSPFGFAVNKKDEIAIATNSVIIHDDRKVETLFILERILCMLEIPMCNEKRHVGEQPFCLSMLGKCIATPPLRKCKPAFFVCGRQNIKRTALSVIRWIGFEISNYESSVLSLLLCIARISNIRSNDS